MDVSTRIKRARQAAGLTQHELARLSGIHQSVIASYESGRRQPNEEACRALLTATGVKPSRLLAEHRAEVLAALTEHGIERALVFGSVARGDDDEGSDLDIILEFPETSSLFDLAEIDALLEEIIGVDVDVVSAGGLKPDRFRSHRAIIDDAVPL